MYVYLLLVGPLLAGCMGIWWMNLFTLGFFPLLRRVCIGSSGWSGAGGVNLEVAMRFANTVPALHQYLLRLSMR